MLVALFFSLGVEQRASEVGLLLATGFPQRAVRRRFLGEGIVLALIGSVIGAAVAVLYAAAMMAALRSWWQAAVGTPFLFLHVSPVSLVVGSAIGFLVVVGSIWLTVRRLGRLSLVALLRGVAREPKGSGGRERAARSRRPRSVLVLWGAAGIGLGFLAVGVALGEHSSPALFFGAGTSLLVSGLALFARRMRRPRADLRPGSGWMPMAARNNALNPGRSLLSAALVSSAAFVIVAVAANGFRYGEEVRELDSAAGGYSIVAESSIPIHDDLTSEDAAFEFGFSAEGRDLLAASAVTPFRLLPGDDVSCLNLYQPESPRILGVPPAQIDRGGFRFQRLERPTEDPWELLTEDRGEVVPAFGDNESMTWILKMGLGDELIVENENGSLAGVPTDRLAERGLSKLQQKSSSSARSARRSSICPVAPGRGGAVRGRRPRCVPSRPRSRTGKGRRHGRA